MANQKYAWMLPEHMALILRAAHDSNLLNIAQYQLRGIRKSVTLDITTRRPTFRMSHDVYIALKSLVMSSDQLQSIEAIAGPYACPPDDPFCLDR